MIWEQEQGVLVSAYMRDPEKKMSSFLSIKGGVLKRTKLNLSNYPSRLALSSSFYDVSWGNGSDACCVAKHLEASLPRYQNPP